MARPKLEPKRAVNIELPIDLAEQLEAVKAQLKREADGASISFADAVRVTLRRGLSR